MSAVDITTYGGALLDVGYPGMIVDLNEAHIINLANESATAIDFGQAVAAGATDKTCKPVDNIANVIQGLAVRHAVMPSLTAPGVTPDVKYARYAAVPILEIGRMYATAGANVAKGDSVYVVIATGALTNTSNSSANPQVPGAKWDTTTSSGQLGIVRIVK